MRADYTLNTPCVLSRGYTCDPFSLCQKVVTLDSIKLSSALVAAGACVVHVCCGLIKLTEAPVMDGARHERRVTQCCSRFPPFAGPRGLLGPVHEVRGPVHKVCGGRSTKSLGADPRSPLGPVHTVCGGRSTKSVGSVHEISWGRSTRPRGRSKRSAGDRSTNSVRAGALLE